VTDAGAAPRPRGLELLITTGRLFADLVKHLANVGSLTITSFGLISPVGWIAVRALMGQVCNGLPHFLVALEPVEHPQTCGMAKSRPQRAEVAAEEPLDDRPAISKGCDIGDKGHARMNSEWIAA